MPDPTRRDAAASGRSTPTERRTRDAVLAAGLFCALAVCGPLLMLTIYSAKELLRIMPKGSGECIAAASTPGYILMLVSAPILLVSVTAAFAGFMIGMHRYLLEADDQGIRYRRLGRLREAAWIEVTSVTWRLHSLRPRIDVYTRSEPRITIRCSDIAGRWSHCLPVIESIRDHVPIECQMNWKPPRRRKSRPKLSSGEMIREGGLMAMFVFQMGLGVTIALSRLSGAAGREHFLVTLGFLSLFGLLALSLLIVTTLTARRVPNDTGAGENRRSHQEHLVTRAARAQQGLPAPAWDWVITGVSGYGLGAIWFSWAPIEQIAHRGHVTAMDIVLAAGFFIAHIVLLVAIVAAIGIYDRREKRRHGG